MKNDLTVKDLEEMLGMKQELDILKDRFHNTLTPEQLSILTAPKGSYPAEQEEKCETDYSSLKAKLKELKAKYGNDKR